MRWPSQWTKKALQPDRRGFAESQETENQGRSRCQGRYSIFVCGLSILPRIGLEQRASKGMWGKGLGLRNWYFFTRPGA